MVVHLIIEGLQEDWNVFTEHLYHKDPRVREAAIYNATHGQLKRAVFALQLHMDDGLRVFAIQSLKERISKHPVWADDTDVNQPLKTDEDLRTALDILRHMLENSKGTGTRYDLFEILKIAAEKRSEDEIRLSGEGNSLFQDFLPFLAEGLTEGRKTAILCSKILAMKDYEYVDDGIPVFGEKAVHVLLDGLSKGANVARSCGSVLGALGRNREKELLYSDVVIPALEKARERFKSQSREAAWEMEDAIDQIRHGIVRSTEHRKHLGTDEPLRIPLFAKRPVPDNNKKRGRKKLPSK